MSADIEIDPNVLSAVHGGSVAAQPAAEIGRIEGMIVQADLVLSRYEIGNRVTTRTGCEHERIVARTAAHEVVAGAAHQQIVAGSAVQRIIPAIAEQQVLAVAAIDGVAAGVAGKNLVCRLLLEKKN